MPAHQLTDRLLIVPRQLRAGQVKKVVQEGEILTVTPSSGIQYTVVVPNILQKVYPDDMQAAASSGGVTLPTDVYAATKAPDTSWLGLLLTGSCRSRSSGASSSS